MLPRVADPARFIHQTLLSPGIMGESESITNNAGQYVPNFDFIWQQV